MPSGDRLSAVQAWAESADRIADFTVAPADGENKLVVSYVRRERLGPVKPPWESWGYGLPYLESSGAVPQTPSSPSPFGWRWLGMVLAMLAIGVAVRRRIAQARQKGIGIRPLFTRPGAGWWWMSAVVFAVAFVMFPALAQILHLNGADYVPAMFRDLTGASAWTKVVALLGVGLIAPFVEECLFRGLVYGRFRAFGYGLSGAAISAAIFTACHAGPPLYLTEVFVAGLGLAWLYQRTGSLWPPVAVHVVNNVLFVLWVLR
jgi:membrane protease YdiL (CAAX protease family)